MDVLRQYETIGQAYIDGQASFFSAREDWARKFIKGSVSPLQGKRLLDIGCGHGVDVQQYEAGGAIAHGIDVSPFMVNEAKKRVQRPEFLQVSDLRSLPFENGYFDAVVSRYGFHYIDDLDPGFREAARVLKPGGLLSLILPHPIYDALVMHQKYSDKFTVKIPLYDGKVTVTYPAHALSDYLSATFNELFHLEGLSEFLADESKDKHFEIPSAIALAARKR